MNRPLHSIVVLTGAGISAESGIRTFRAADGLWEDHRIEDVATPQAFDRNPQLVHHFYNLRRRQLLSHEIQPNSAHLALARFEREFAGQLLMVTQNVDNLHERAGSRNVLHMHGELLKMRCIRTHLVFDIAADVDFDTLCRCCREPGNLRPHIVWFGEIPFHMAQIDRALECCDLFIAIGTSGNVYPAAGFYETAKRYHAYTVELNLEQTPCCFDEHLCGPATQVVPRYLDQLLRQTAGSGIRKPSTS